ncbi:RICIN domain-containing protein [Actinacidiphila sp. DG2A-62]|uniref:RICIN domain-containing protein n=1 Tax=Actinacidiphila sp. DG2A-62 TaxID=3108821 RepID=UPI002DB89E03|nr:RICIN domain-containing protein [Actinacidiphila sp. DG2A-62]MEC3993805.1 RICIN domain-containing protein [Actinacidiphila sp. DG2A-62]
MSSSEQREPVGGAEPAGTPAGAPRPETPRQGGDAAAPPGGGVGVGTAVRSLLRRPRAEVSRRPDPGSPAIWDRDDHVLPAPVTGPSGPGGGSTPPGRPTRTVVWAAVCGVALLSVPFVVVAAGSHGDKPHGAAHTTLADDDRPAPAVPGTVAAPLPPSPSPTASSTRKPPHKPSRKPSLAPSPSVAHVAGRAAPHTKAAPPPVRTPAPHKPTFAEVFGGANRVLLKNLATGMCADLPQYGKGSVGGVIDQYDCQAGAADNQEWDLKVVGGPKGPGGARLFTISNDADHLCMDIPWYGVEPVGTRVTEYTCDATTDDNQLWYLAPGQGSHYRIRNYVSGSMCLGVAGGAGTPHGVSLIVETCKTTSDDWAMTTG